MDAGRAERAVVARRRSALALYLALLAGLLLLQLPLIANPGYFSHDELQWWARADVASLADLPWLPWLDAGAFQYRPLTFNLWLLLAYAFAATPWLMHLVLVALGSTNAALLAAVTEGAGGRRRVAAAAAVVFVLSPFVAYTHGWTATLADLLILCVALLSLLQVQRIGPATSSAIVAIRLLAVMLLSTIALLAKESGVVLPVILLAAFFGHPRPRAVAAAVALSGATVAVYLHLRLDVILDTPAGASAYAWRVVNVPTRLLEYLVYPFMPPLFEIGPILSKSPGRLIAAGTCVVALLAALGSVGWRWPLAWLGFVAGLLAPVLVLGYSYDHYAYLASAGAVAVAAAAWPRLSRASRFVVIALAVVVAVHAGSVMLRMRAVGVVQANFYADLLPRLAASDVPLVFAARDASDHWMAVRFIEGVPAYRGVAITGRVRIVDAAQAPALWMTSDGHLVEAMPR